MLIVRFASFLKRIVGLGAPGEVGALMSFNAELAKLTRQEVVIGLEALGIDIGSAVGSAGELTNNAGNPVIFWDTSMTYLFSSKFL